jgi:hypothetical protein
MYIQIMIHFCAKNTLTIIRKSIAISLEKKERNPMLEYFHARAGFPSSPISISLGGVPGTKRRLKDSCRGVVAPELGRLVAGSSKNRTERAGDCSLDL